MKYQEKLSRHAFLRSLGFGGSALMAVYLSSCVNESVNPGNSNGSRFTLDLTAAANSALLNAGGYVISNNIVVANVGNGSYAAVTRTCSHEGQKQVIFNNGEFLCTAHGARFSTTGQGLNGNGSRGLTTYPVSVAGNILTIG